MKFKSEYPTQQETIIFLEQCRKEYGYRTPERRALTLAIGAVVENCFQKVEKIAEKLEENLDKTAKRV